MNRIQFKRFASYLVEKIFLGASLYAAMTDTFLAGQRQRQAEKALAAPVIVVGEHVPQDGGALALFGHKPVKSARLYQPVIFKGPLVRDKGITLDLFAVSVFCTGEFRALTAGIQAAVIRAAGFHRAGRVLALKALAAAAGAP